MGKQDGFLLYQRHEDSERAETDRIRDYQEIRTSLDPEKRKEQAGRCMMCGVPFCQSGMILNGMATGCPLHNLIPEWNDEIWRGHEAAALKRLLKMNPFPEFTGRVCPALCEKACLNGVDSEPVTIRDNERYLIEYAYAHDLMRPSLPAVRSGKKAAVIGSGPAGLAAAERLNQRGHEVTVYERDEEPGGLLMFGIPNMKLDKEVIRRRIRKMEEEGITFITSCHVGKDISLHELKEQYDAVVLACGAKQARIPDTEGIDDTEGVVMAVQYLSDTTRSIPSLPKVNAKGKNVIILGGGDTGNDCVATAIRQGCLSVTQLEMMPEPPKERTADNPWPEWPKVLKTDYGQEEAIAVFKKDPRLYCRTVTKLIKEDGTLKQVETAEIHFENRKAVYSEDRNILACDLLIIAAGFTGCERELPESYGIELSPRNTVMTEAGSYCTNKEGFFTAGDMHRGQSLVVWAIKEGMECARQVDEYLMGYTNLI